MRGFASPFLEELDRPTGSTTVELRPPPQGRSGSETIDAWIDAYHGVRKLVRNGRFVFLTDNAVGSTEEENLSHLSANLAEEVDPSRVIPFLTCKHEMEYCLMYAERAWAQGFRALTVLGGDRHVGPPRCVPHAYLLRQKIRERVPAMALGGWVNPHADPAAQVGFLQNEGFTGEFWLSQVVSHHSIGRVEALLRELDRAGTPIPGVFGVFFYRSANRRTLEILSRFFPVPAEELQQEFSSGSSPEEVCAKSLRALSDLGIRNVYLSNFLMRNAEDSLSRVLDLV